jgi:hypothetical protein
MPSLEFATATLSLPVWAAGGAVALFVIIGALTLTRRGVSLAGSLLRVVAVVAGLGSVWLLLDQATQHERAAERRALDQRAADLAARAIAPGSPLACLDAVAGDAVESACEKTVFATPEAVAAAVSYMSARLSLLADSTEFARRFGGYDGALATQRLGIEADRYGLVAHVLSVRDSCTPLLCDSYVLLHDPDRVQANLRDRLFDRYVDRYAADWSARAQAAAVAAGPASGYSTASVPGAPASGMPVTSKYDFPSAASIPPVSIMNPEPGTSPEAKPELKPDAKTTTGTLPARRPQTTATHAPSRTPQPAAPSMAPANSSATALH